MKINKVYIGNNNEAYVSPCFNDGINLVYSNENNKGKTILIQAIGFAFGNIAIFPNGFNYKDYFFIVDFEHDDKQYSVCRKNSEYYVNFDDGGMLLHGESDFKKWFNNNFLNFQKLLKTTGLLLQTSNYYYKFFT